MSYPARAEGLVNMMCWTSAHYVFAVESFLKTGESVIATQKTFCAHFMRHRNDAVPDRIFNPPQASIFCLMIIYIMCENK